MANTSSVATLATEARITDDAAVNTVSNRDYRGV